MNQAIYIFFTFCCDDPMLWRALTFCVCAKKEEGRDRKCQTLAKGTDCTCRAQSGSGGWGVVRGSPSAEFGLCEIPGRDFMACPCCLWIAQQFCVGGSGEAQAIYWTRSLGLFSEEKTLALLHWLSRLLACGISSFWAEFVCASLVQMG